MLELTPLDDSRLTPSVRQVVARTAPAPARLMAARGLAPLPPAELVTALYQIALTADGDDALAATAKATLTKLPERVLQGALGAELDARVIDFAARALGARARASLAVVLANRATADETYAFLAAVCDEGELELIARNEMRLVRHPAIIEALFRNLKCRQSTASRAVELAVRAGVTLDGIPLFDELKAAILAETSERGPSGDGAADAAFRAAVAATESVEEPELVAMAFDPVDESGALMPMVEAEIKPGALVPVGTREHAPGALVPVADSGTLVPVEPGAPEPTPVVAVPIDKADAEQKALPIKDLSVSAKMRLALSGNAFARGVLIRDKNRVVALTAIRSPTVSDSEVTRYAANRELAEEVIRHIANNREWLRLYTVKRALVNNPKTPLASAMRLLPFLTPRDLRSVARSKGIPSTLAKAAMNLIHTRQGK